MAAPASPPTPRIWTGQVDRRLLWATAAVLVVAILGGVALVALSVDTDRATDPDTQVTQGTTPSGAPCLLAPEDGSAGIAPDPDCAAPSEDVGRPSIITRPNSGKAPEGPGDRGGWEQLALLGLLLAAMAGIGVVIFRGGRKARAGRSAWEAAAATGRDGAASTVIPVDAGTSKGGA